MRQTVPKLTRRVRCYFSAMSTWPLEERLIQPGESEAVSFTLKIASWVPGLLLLLIACLGMILSDTSIDAVYSLLPPDAHLYQFWQYGGAAHAEFTKLGDLAFARRFATTSWVGAVLLAGAACVLAVTLSVVTFCAGTAPSHVDRVRFIVVSIGAALWSAFVTALFWAEIDVYGITNTPLSTPYAHDASSFLLLAIGPSTVMLAVAPWVLYATKVILASNKRSQNTAQKESRPKN